MMKMKKKKLIIKQHPNNRINKLHLCLLIIRINIFIVLICWVVIKIINNNSNNFNKPNPPNQQPNKINFSQHNFNLNNNHNNNNNKLLCINSLQIQLFINIFKHNFFLKADQISSLYIQSP